MFKYDNVRRLTNGCSYLRFVHIIDHKKHRISLCNSKPSEMNMNATPDIVHQIKQMVCSQLQTL